MQIPIFKPDLVDAQKMHQDHPQTFAVPDASELNSIRVSDRIKVCNHLERFWVEVTEVTPTYLRGIVKNPLVYESGYNYGDILEFTRDNVYVIYSKEEMKTMTTLNIVTQMRESGASKEEIIARVEENLKSYE